MASCQKLLQDGYYRDSLSVCSKAVDITREKRGLNSKLSAWSLVHYSKALYSMDQLEESLQMSSIVSSILGSDEFQGDQSAEELLIENHLISSQVYLKRSMLNEASLSISTASSLLSSNARNESPLVYSLLQLQTAQLFEHKGQLLEAVESFTRAIHCIEAVNPSDYRPPQLKRLQLVKAEAHYHLGLLYVELGVLQGIRNNLDQTIQIRKDLLDSNHPDMADALDSMAVLLFMSGNLAGPLPLLDKAHRIRVDRLGNKHTRVAQSYFLRAFILEHVGDIKKAQNLHRRGFHIIREVLGNDHPDLATPYAAMARYALAKNEFEPAGKWLSKAIEIREKHFGDSHPRVLVLRMDQARMLMRQAKYLQAKSVLTQVKKVLSQDPQHQKLNLSKINRFLYKIFILEGDTKKAKELLYEALQMMRESLGIDHPQVGSLLQEVVGLHHDRKEYEAAVILLREYTDQLIENNSRDHPEVLPRLTLLIFMEQMALNWSEAVAGFEVLLDIQRRNFGSAHPEVAKTLISMGALHRKLDNLEEAEKFEKEARLINMGGNPEDKDILFAPWQKK